MDIKEKIEEIVETLKKDEDLLKKFQKDPVSVIEKLIGVDLPNDQLDKIVDAIKAKINIDKIGDVLEGLGGLGGLFGKK